MEHYAGCGELTQAASERFGRAVKLDKEYHRAMNILTPAGFAILCSIIHASMLVTSGLVSI